MGARSLTVAIAAAAIATTTLGAGSEAEAKPIRTVADTPYYLSYHPVAKQSPKRKRTRVLMLHGGGWVGDLGQDADPLMQGWIERLRRRGYEVANLGYRSGAKSLGDSVAAFDRVRARAPKRPICVAGGSAGAHLALMIAVRRPGRVDCVLAEGGPPDLTDFGSAPASESARRHAADVFGEDRLRRLSPMHRAGRIRAAVMVSAAPCDTFTSIDRQRAFVRGLRDARARRVAFHRFVPGSRVYASHCQTTSASFKEFLQREARFIAKVERSRRR